MVLRNTQDIYFLQLLNSREYFFRSFFVCNRMWLTIIWWYYTLTLEYGSFSLVLLIAAAAELNFLSILFTISVISLLLIFKFYAFYIFYLCVHFCQISCSKSRKNTRQVVQKGIYKILYGTAHLNVVQTKSLLFSVSQGSVLKAVHWPIMVYFYKLLFGFESCFIGTHTTSSYI